MKVAFSGSSGAGKTTLVTWAAQELGLTHRSGSAGDIKSMDQKWELWDKHGYPGGGHLGVIKYSALNPEYGRDNQAKLLQGRSDLIRTQDNFITDRSPCDNAAYFLTQCAYAATDAQTKEHLDKCIEAYGMLTHVIFIRAVQPIDLGVEKNGSRVDNQYYQKFVIDQVFKKCFDELFRPAHPHVNYLEIDFWDLDQRKAAVVDFLSA